MSENNSISMRFCHIEESNDLIPIIEHEARALKRRHPQIRNCGVVVQKKHQRHLKGNPIRAMVTIGLPGKVVVSSKKGDDPDEFVSASTALAHAFDAAEHSVASYLNRFRMRRHGRLRSRLNEYMATV